MARFIPREKLGKKARRQLDNRNRLFWPFPPASKIFKSGKEYSRHRKSHEFQNEWIRGVFFILKDRAAEGKNPAQPGTSPVYAGLELLFEKINGVEYNKSLYI